ncbi:MAG: hypothetical protein ACXAEN_20925 [Candidatus Thorarchaeota archaeon]|jgi:hypothetical protein
MMSKEQKKTGDESDKKTEAEKITALEAELAKMKADSAAKAKYEANLKAEEEAKVKKAAEDKEKEELERESNLADALNKAMNEESKGLSEDDELTPKQLLGIVGDAVAKANEASSKLVLKKVTDLVAETNKGVQGTQQALIELITNLSVEKVNDKYKDFGDYKDDVRQIMGATNGLSLDQAYLLAKAQKGEGQPKQEQVETERPFTQDNSMVEVMRPTDYTRESGSKSEAVQLTGRRAFNAAVDAGIDKVLARKTRP